MHKKHHGVCFFRNARWMHVLIVGVVLWFPLRVIAGDKLEGDADRFPREITVGESTVQRKGVGRMRRWMITGADVALYAPAGTRRQDLLTGGPLALSFYYYTRIRGEQFARAGFETLQQNVAADMMQEQAENLEKMETFFTDVGRGDRYLLQYEPGYGTTLKRNGKKVGTIEDEAFAAFYFQIWLGENPIDERMYYALVASMPE